MRGMNEGENVGAAPSLQAVRFRLPAVFHCLLSIDLRAVCHILSASLQHKYQRNVAKRCADLVIISQEPTH